MYKIVYFSVLHQDNSSLQTVMEASQIKEVVKKYIKVLKRNKFPYSAVYLYGSHAKNQAKPWSDIDVCVVSNNFSKRSWLAYSHRLWKLAEEVDLKIEPYGMSEETFLSVSPIAEEVRKTGIRIQG